jgi:hypothetical protein
MNRLLALTLALFPCLLLAQGELQFISESIDFELNSDQFSANGIYVFVNSTNREIQQSILFPFAPKAVSVDIKRVYNLTYNQNLPYQFLSNSIIFKLIVFPTDTVLLNISYAQKTDIENIYILTSTHAWKAPISEANYSLRFDPAIRIDSFSYKPDRVEGEVYFWEKSNFYPEYDFKILIK